MKRFNPFNGCNVYTLISSCLSPKKRGRSCIERGLREWKLHGGASTSFCICVGNVFVCTRQVILLVSLARAAIGWLFGPEFMSVLSIRNQGKRRSGGEWREGSFRSDVTLAAAAVCARAMTLRSAFSRGLVFFVLLVLYYFILYFEAFAGTVLYSRDRRSIFFVIWTRVHSEL